MNRRRQVLAAAAVLHALRQAPRPAPRPSVVRPLPARPQSVERAVEKIVERVEAGPDLSGPLAAVDKRARKALESAQAAAERIDAVAATAGSVAEQVQAVRGEVERVSQQVIALESVEASRLHKGPPSAAAPELATGAMLEPIDAPTRAELAEQLQSAVAPLAQSLEAMRSELGSQVAEASRIAGEAAAGATHATAVAASAMSRDIPQPAPLPDFLTEVRVVTGHLIGTYQSGKRRDFGALPKPRVVSGGGRASSAQVAEWAAATSSGGGDVLLTYTAPEQKTVGASAADMVAAGSATNLRRITVWVPNGADTGIYVNPAGTATSSHFLVPPGGHGIWDTNQALSAIRAGSADVTAYVQVGTA